MLQDDKISLAVTVVLSVVLSICKLMFVFYSLSIKYGNENLERTPCVVHTLQLVVNMIQTEPAIKKLLDKLRHLVRLFHQSSVATGRLLEKCGLTLTKDCPTRWSSTYVMMSRALEVKDHVASVAEMLHLQLACS